MYILDVSRRAKIIKSANFSDFLDKNLTYIQIYYIMNLKYQWPPLLQLHRHVLMGGFCLRSVQMSSFSHKSFEEQVALLESRGMLFSGEQDKKKLSKSYQ